MATSIIPAITSLFKKNNQNPINYMAARTFGYPLYHKPYHILKFLRNPERAPIQ